MNLSDIPTPLTDAAEYHPLSDNYLFVVDADFARDLERKLSAAIAEQNRLVRMLYDNFHSAIQATPAQRCEAFLRTLNLWKDNQ